MIASAYFSSFVCFTRLPERIWHQQEKRKNSVSLLFVICSFTNGVETLFVVRALYEIAMKDSAAELETENEWRRRTLCRSCSRLCALSIRIQQDHSKQRVNGVDTLFVVCDFHRVVRKRFFQIGPVRLRPPEGAGPFLFDILHLRRRQFFLMSAHARTTFRIRPTTEFFTRIPKSSFSYQIVYM